MIRLNQTTVSAKVFMTANTTRRLRTAVLIMMVCVPVSLCYEFIESTLDPELEGRISLIGVFVGIVLAMPLAILEDSGFDERMRRLPFSVAMLLKLLAVFMSTGFVGGLLQGLRMEDFWASLAEPGYYTKAAVGFVL